MEENKNENSTNETKETVNTVKDTIKNVKLKEDSLKAKNFVVEMFKDPIGKIKSIISEDDTKNLTVSIILMVIVFVIAMLNAANINNWFKWNRDFFFVIKTLFLALLVPLARVLVPTIMLIIMKKSKKSQITIFSATVGAYTPMIISAIVSLLGIFFTNVSFIVYPISVVASALYAALLFVVTREVVEDESKAIKKFALIELVLGIVLYII